MWFQHVCEYSHWPVNIPKWVNVRSIFRQLPNFNTSPRRSNIHWIVLILPVRKQISKVVQLAMRRNTFSKILVSHLFMPINQQSQEQFATDTSKTLFEQGKTTFCFWDPRYTSCPPFYRQTKNHLPPDLSKFSVYNSQCRSRVNRPCIPGAIQSWGPNEATLSVFSLHRTNRI